MAGRTYDIITVGGGLGGAALAKAMAQQGATVLVLERETQFKDRVRGEVLVPWGVAEAQALGLDDVMRTTCGHEYAWGDAYLGAEQMMHRHFRATTPQQVGELAFYHPAMQEVVLQAAADAGTEVRRGTTVREVKPGSLPTVTLEHNGRIEEARARLVVGADGRGSLVRKWSGFAVHQDPPRMLIAGVMLDQMPGPPDDVAYFAIDSRRGRIAYLFPQGHGRVRAYTSYHKDVDAHRLQGLEDYPRFVAECIKTGAPADWYAGARVSGPLATFEGSDTWTEHPYRDGVVLVGDAAAASDPTWGQGLALTLRDARVLRDHLLSEADWDAAGHSYAEEHDRYYGVIHRVDNWWADLFLERGPEAEARRARALPLLAQDSARTPDHIWSGPELPADETVRRRFFGEE